MERQVLNEEADRINKQLKIASAKESDARGAHRAVLSNIQDTGRRIKGATQEVIRVNE